MPSRAHRATEAAVSTLLDLLSGMVGTALVVEGGASSDGSFIRIQGGFHLRYYAFLAPNFR